MTKKELISYISEKYHYSYKEEINYTASGIACDAVIHLKSIPTGNGYYEETELTIFIGREMFCNKLNGELCLLTFKDLELIQLIIMSKFHLHNDALCIYGDEKEIKKFMDKDKKNE